MKHFARINHNGTVSRCGHMSQPPQFLSYDEMESSAWLKDAKNLLAKNIWPKECIRCQTSESVGHASIRQNEIEFYKKAILQNPHYLIIGGVLDNICNSACQSCNASHSTKIGSLSGKDYIRINNKNAFSKLPLDRILKLDINGGEPAASPAYQALLENLPPNLKYLRVNTNGSKVLPNLQRIIDQGVAVTVTVSLDGIGKIHDYVRWPVKWEAVDCNIKEYKKYNIELNTWTTVHALNIGNLKDIVEYTKENDIDHSWALLEQPDVLSIRYKNYLTSSAIVPAELNLNNVLASSSDNSAELNMWIMNQDSLRGIDIKDYY